MHPTIFNKEIEANKIFTSIREKNAFMTNADSHAATTFVDVFKRHCEGLSEVDS